MRVMLCSLFVSVIVSLFACSRGDDEPCPPASIVDFEQGLLKQDSSLFLNYVESRRCQERMHQLLAVDVHGVDSLVNHIFARWYLQQRTDFIREWSSVGRPKSSLARITRYQAVPDSVLVHIEGRQAKVQKTRLLLPMDAKFEEETLRFYSMSRRETFLLDSLLRKPGCKEWSDSCYFPERKRFVDAYFNVHMGHWGEGSYTCSFPIVENVSLNGWPSSELRIHARTHIGSDGSFLYRVMENGEWKLTENTDGTQE
jgi:hypothetical protein